LEVAVLAEAKSETTVLFAEVSGGAQLLLVAGQIEGARAIGQCIDRIRQVAESSGGKFVRVIGDEVMMLFDTPDRAAEAANQMHDAVAALPPVRGAKLAVQVGFHSGPIYQSGENVLGDTIKLAAALVHQAQRGQTITSHRTAERLGSAFRSFSTQLVTVPVPSNGRKHTLNTPMLHLKYAGEVVPCWRENESVVIGRERGCGLVIQNKLASRRHCTVRLRAEGGFVVRDHSSNGTYVTNAEGDEMLVRDAELPLVAPGCISFGTSRRLRTEVHEFFVQQ
jgi:adenylate cyclase